MAPWDKRLSDTVSRHIYSLVARFVETSCPRAERDFAWAARFLRLSRNNERLATTMAGR